MTTLHPFINAIAIFCLSLSALLLTEIQARPSQESHFNSIQIENVQAQECNLTCSIGDNYIRTTGILDSIQDFGLRATVQRPGPRAFSVKDEDKRNKNDDDNNFFEELDIDIETQHGSNCTWPIDNDFFHGRLCLLLRDHPKCDYNFDNQTDIFFELQVQGRFKRKPKGPLYMGLEIPNEDEVKLSWPLKTFLKAAISFMKSWGYNWIYFNLKKSESTPQMISSPAFQAFDRIVITSDEETPPHLGYAIPELEEDAFNRKNFKFDHKISTDQTYTMSFNHTYVDLLRWKVNGIPVVNSFHFGFTDSMRLIMYEVDEHEEDTDGHVQALSSSAIHKKRDVVFWIKFVNVDKKK